MNVMQEREREEIPVAISAIVPLIVIGGEIGPAWRCLAPRDGRPLGGRAVVLVIGGDVDAYAVVLYNAQ